MFIFIHSYIGGHGDVALALPPRRLVVMGHHGWLPTRRGIPRTGAPFSWIFKRKFCKGLTFFFLCPSFFQVSPAVLVPSAIDLMEKSMGTRKGVPTRSTNSKKKYNISLLPPGRVCLRGSQIKIKYFIIGVSTRFTNSNKLK